MNEYYCFCVHSPPRGLFTVEKKYFCAIPEAKTGVLIYDDNHDAVIFENHESNLYFEFYIEHEEVPIDEWPDERLFIVLAWGKTNHFRDKSICAHT